MSQYHFLLSHLPAVFAMGFPVDFLCSVLIFSIFYVILFTKVKRGKAMQLYPILTPEDLFRDPSAASPSRDTLDKTDASPYPEETISLHVHVVSMPEGFLLFDEEPYLPRIAAERTLRTVAMKSAAARNLPNLVIYHDYEGIAKWCTGEWKAKKKWTKKYKAFYQEMSQKIDISFVKVAAHTGDVYNEQADKLAKEAVGNK